MLNTMNKHINCSLSIIFITFFLYSSHVFSAVTAAQIQEFVDAHNTRRAAHGAAPVTWSGSIAATAQAFADTCSMGVHSTNTSNGENIFLSSATSTPTTAVTNWYNEVSLYNFNNPGFNSATGHFTQVVWKATTAIGCGIRADCPTTPSNPFGFNLICQYSPAGNVLGQFAQNVMAAVSAPEIEVTGNNVLIVDGDTTPSGLDHSDFGNAVVGTGTITRTFTIRNTGNADLTLSSMPIVALSGNNAADFTVTVMPSSPVTGGNSVTFVVSFVPSAIGTRTAELSIVNNDADENPYNFAIQGTGTTILVPIPEIEVTGNSNLIADGDTSPVLTDHTDFGGTDVTSGIVTRIFTVRNTGANDLNLTGTPIVAVSGVNANDFSVTTQPTSPVSSGNSVTFNVTFNPSTAGVRTAILTIANNDTDENPYNFSIQGTGTSTPTDNDGVSAVEEDAAPNNGDGNDDNIPDSTQNHVASLSGKTAGSYYTVEVGNGCTQVSSTSTTTEGALGNDAGFDFPVGLVQFTLNCSSADITIYLHGLASAPNQLRKYGATSTSGGSNVWYQIPAIIDSVVINGQSVHRARYSLVDGGLGDDDLIVNGVIVDPVGPAILASTSPQPTTGRPIPTLSEWTQLLLALLMVALVAIRLDKIRLRLFKAT